MLPAAAAGLQGERLLQGMRQLLAFTAEVTGVTGDIFLPHVSLLSFPSQEHKKILASGSSGGGSVKANQNVSVDERSCEPVSVA